MPQSIGFFKIYRDIFHKFSTDPILNNNLLNVFIYLVCNAVWDDFDGLKRGQVKVSTKDVQEWMPYVNVTRVRHLIRILVEKGFINHVKKSDHKFDFSVYEICQYDTFSGEVSQKTLNQSLTSASLVLNQCQSDKTIESLDNNHVELTGLTSASPVPNQCLTIDGCSYYIEERNKEIKEVKSKRATRTRHVKKSISSEGKSVPVINHYVQLYRNRYGQDPIINAAVRSQACKLVDSVGADRALVIVETYLKSRDIYYLKKAHPFGLCLSDANKLNIESSRSIPVLEKPVVYSSFSTGLDSMNSYLDEMGVKPIDEIPF